MEQSWSEGEDAMPVRLLRDAMRRWRDWVGNAESSLQTSAADRRPQRAEEAAARTRGRVRRGADPDPFAYVRVGIDPLDIHLD